MTKKPKDSAAAIVRDLAGTYERRGESTLEAPISYTHDQYEIHRLIERARAIMRRKKL